uniref:SCD domain-containing protein n=1 Tax=Globodera pallida TaxID=36090 RepID=A0A183C523_GLOPA
MHSTKTSNTYSLRVRKPIAFDRDYSPDPPGQPVRKKAKVQGNNVTPKRGPRKYGGVNQQQQNQVGGEAVPKFAVPAVQDPYFLTLKTGRNPTSLAEKWIHDYEESPDQAIVQMLQLIVASCGCSGKLDANMIHNMQWKDIIERISEYFDEDSGDYPLILTTHQFRRFRNNFAEFLQSFVIRSKNNILFDVTLMDSLIQLLTLLSDNPIRAFRHTATFASMKLSSSIVDVVVELVDLKDKNVIQIETEKARLLHAGTNERLERLLQAKTELDQKIDELSAMLQYIFKCVFVHRYRDHVADFRIICVSELGIWIRIYPALFLDDSYLKYIGWSLFDKVPEVRQKCISALLPLYENNKLIRRLELFTHKFKDRLVSMVMDTDVEVATKTCQLMAHIYRAFPVLLDPGACVPLYELVYCNNRQLAAAAGEFVNAKLFSTSTDDKNVIQIETEKARLLHAGTNERLERLLQAKTELDQKIDELSAMLQYIFKCVFVHRYRDHVADFRIICVSELGIWIRIYPALFLDDSYLKYIGWSLFDKVPEVRQKCISALLPLYENNKLIRRLELFTHKFKDRLVSMVMDTDVEVATKTCQLMAHIYRAFPVLLDPGACVPLYELVYCNNRQLAAAAGEFVNAKLFSTSTDASMMSSSTSILAPPVDNRQLIKDLVAFFIDGDVHRHPAYLVDSLIDICPMLKDWPTMVDILLSEE